MIDCILLTFSDANIPLKSYPEMANVLRNGAATLGVFHVRQTRRRRATDARGKRLVLQHLNSFKLRSTAYQTGIPRHVSDNSESPDV